MRLEGGKLVFEEHPCPACHGTGRGVMRRIPCARCGGTGRGPRGGRAGCRSCRGSGEHWRRDNRVPCPKCEGTGRVPETPHDTVPSEVWRELPCRVVTVASRHEEGGLHTSGHSLLQHDDRGQAWTRLTEASRKGPEALAAAEQEIIAEVHDTTPLPVWAGDLTRDGRLCSHLVIAVDRRGWTVSAAFSGQGGGHR